MNPKIPQSINPKAMDAWTQMHNTAQDKIKAHSEKPFEYGDHHWTQT